MKVVEFKTREDPHASGEAICTHCKHEWIAVAPIGEVDLECPSCSSHRGVFKYPFGAPEGAECFQCHCGSQDFFIYRQVGRASGATYCRGCGSEATGWFE